MGTRIYVGGLPRDATSREVQDAFSRYGHISNVWIARNPPGFAFVDFEDPRDADDAIRAMDNRDFLGGRVRVELAKGGSRRDDRGGRGRDDRRGGGDRYDRGGRNPPQRTDFKVRITDLPRGVDWRDVKDHLRSAGEVTFCDVQSDGTALAEFQTREDMENAVAKLDDKEFRGSYIRVTAEGAPRGRSNSPRRDRSPDQRSRSRSPGARQASPRRSRSPSPAAAHSPPPRKNSV